MKKTMLITTLLFISIGISIGMNSCTKKSAKIVTDATIKRQKKLTQAFQLNNGIPVVLRQTPESPIIAIDVSFEAGIRDTGKKYRMANRLMWSMLSSASKNFPKQKVFELTEKYSLAIGCREQLETAHCSLTVIKDYWEKALPLFVDLLINPSLTKEDYQLAKARLTAKLKSIPTDPSSYVNQIVNSVFYASTHPFSPNHEQELAMLEKTTLEDVRQNINAS